MKWDVIWQSAAQAFILQTVIQLIAFCCFAFTGHYSSNPLFFLLITVLSVVGYVFFAIYFKIATSY